MDGDVRVLHVVPKHQMRRSGGKGERRTLSRPPELALGKLFRRIGADDVIAICAGGARERLERSAPEGQVSAGVADRDQKRGRPRDRRDRTTFMSSWKSRYRRTFRSGFLRPREQFESHRAI